MPHTNMAEVVQKSDDEKYQPLNFRYSFHSISLSITLPI